MANIEEKVRECITGMSVLALFHGTALSIVIHAGPDQREQEGIFHIVRGACFFPQVASEAVAAVYCTGMYR